MHANDKTICKHSHVTSVLSKFVSLLDTCKMATYNLIIGTNVNWVYKDLETLNILTLEVRSLMQQLGEVFQNAISDKTQHRKFSRIYVVLLAINMIFFLRHRSPTILSNALNFTMKINLNLQNQWEKTYITYIQNDLNLSKIFPHQTMVISFYYTHMCVWALIQRPSRGPVSEQSPK